MFDPETDRVVVRSVLEDLISQVEAGSSSDSNEYDFSVQSSQGNWSEVDSVDQDVHVEKEEEPTPPVDLEDNKCFDIDMLMEREMSRLWLTRQTRAKVAKNKQKHRTNWTLSELLNKPTTSKDTFPVTHSICQADNLDINVAVDVFDCISRISTRIPESNDDLDDYRLSSALFAVSKLTELTRTLNWRIRAMGLVLGRSLREIKFLKVALIRITTELKDEFELLRKNTVTTLRKIIECDISRREKMRQQWDEVQTFIRRKNKRIVELTDQLSGADVEVGFLLASHKERIEAVCVAERNFFIAQEKVEDLELELKEKDKILESKICVKCASNKEETDKERQDREEREKKREEQRKQFEDTEKKKIADAARVGKALQKHVEAAFEHLGPNKSPAPWHNGSKGQQNGHANPGQQPMFKPGYVPVDIFHVTKLRLEEMEQQVADQERMNQILSRDVEKYKKTQDHDKLELDRLTKENRQLREEVDKLKEAMMNNAEPNHVSPPMSVSSRGSTCKDELVVVDEVSDESTLPKPPEPPASLRPAPKPNRPNNRKKQPVPATISRAQPTPPTISRAQPTPPTISRAQPTPPTISRAQPTPAATVAAPSPRKPQPPSPVQQQQQQPKQRRRSPPRFFVDRPADRKRPIPAPPLMPPSRPPQPQPYYRDYSPPRVRRDYLDDYGGRAEGPPMQRSPDFRTLSPPGFLYRDEPAADFRVETWAQRRPGPPMLRPLGPLPGSRLFHHGPPPLKPPGALLVRREPPWSTNGGQVRDPRQPTSWIHCRR